MFIIFFIVITVKLVTLLLLIAKNEVSFFSVSVHVGVGFNCLQKIYYD